MELESNSYNTFAIQTTQKGKVLGAAVFLPADILGRFVTDGAGNVVYKLKQVPEGILIEIGGKPQ